MTTILRQCTAAAFFLASCQNSIGFQSIQRNRRSNIHRLSMNPNEISNAALSHEVQSELSAMMSTLLAPAIQPAQGHSNPLFGPPDKFLEAGRSIAPSSKALSDMGISQPSSLNEMIPDASPEFQASVSKAVDGGWKLLDNGNVLNGGATHFPGFSDVSGLFYHSPNVPPETPQSFAAEVQWAAGYFDVIDKLPYVAFWYAMVEFFILRPNIDLYKEDIEDDTVGVTFDTVAVTGVKRFIPSYSGMEAFCFPIHNVKRDREQPNQLKNMLKMMKTFDETSWLVLAPWISPYWREKKAELNIK